jgi:pullulanase-type alpha-1,6-glucosidase
MTINVSAQIGATLTGDGAGTPTQARAHWVARDTIAWQAPGGEAYTYTLHYASNGASAHLSGNGDGEHTITLTYDPAGLCDAIKAGFPHLALFPAFKIKPADLSKVPRILQCRIAVAATDTRGRIVDATGLQIPGVLDDLYTYTGALGVSYTGATPMLRLWAPTATSVRLHLFDDAETAAHTIVAMAYDSATGVWNALGDPSWTGKFYLYEVDVFVRTTGQFERNLVTDPYSYSLSTNSTRSQIVDLNDPQLEPAGWRTLRKPPLAGPQDIVLYELHVRDFSVHDPLAPEAYRGTFKAFTVQDSYGMRHLRQLADAGLTHIHLLPVFDIATINERKAHWQAPDPTVLAAFPPDSDRQAAAVAAIKDQDGFNWGYDPFHYTVPEGSYATDPNGAVRVREFREMVQALSDAGLRVVMDVVYNHTNSSGQCCRSVLDKIVPGYYHRLNWEGEVEQSTCCANTATEHAMMEKLMIDSLVTWARAYKVDGFRFDLMGHHMRSNMIKAQAALRALTLEDDGVDGSKIFLYGEGWNFGEVANNARGVNATQFNLGGLGIGTFNDRLRDAVRGGVPFDAGEQMRRQGFINGLFYDPNGIHQGYPHEQHARLLQYADQIRVGLTGNLAQYAFVDRYGNWTSGWSIEANGAPTGYTLAPQEAITYVEAHDNQTLFDVLQIKAPDWASIADRVRMQNLAMSIVMLGQGVPFVHAGQEMLRSKSMNRDSYNSGDWFNKLDFTYETNNWGVGLPPGDQVNWHVLRPLLANPALRPGRAEIVSAVEHVREMLRIRKSSRLFRLTTAEEVQRCVSFLNTGPHQIPGLIVMALIGHGAQDMRLRNERIVVLFNATTEVQRFVEGSLVGALLELHPVQAASADSIVRAAYYDAATGAFVIPPRTTAVFVSA